MLDLYWDTDSSGADGTLIVKDYDINVSGRRYDWSVGNLPEGEYHVYGVADDDVHAPVVEYASGTIQVPAYGPSITMLEPAASGVVADSVYRFVWTDEAPNANALIDIYLDPDSNRNNGNQILMASGFSEDDETDAAVLDISSVTEGTYYVLGAINQSATPEDAVWDYSPRQMTIVHDGAPQLFFIDPAPNVIAMATGGNLFTVPIRF